MAEDGRTGILQSGGLSGRTREDDESRRVFRKGQIDWIEAIAKPIDFELWEFDFIAGANMYLSKTVYPDPNERRDAWLFALIRAAQLGGFVEMRKLLQLNHKGGLRCEELLEALRKQFLPAIETERKKCSKKFMDFQRQKRTLMQAVKDLRVVLLDCNKFGFNPCEATVRAKYEGMLSAQELPLFKLYLVKGNRDDTVFAHFMAAMEELAKDQETATKYATDAFQGAEGTGDEQFAGGVFKKARGAPKRKGYAPEKTSKGTEGKTNDKRKCSRCGKDNCPALSGGNKASCSAANEVCRKCGKKGHFERVCRSKVAATATALGDESSGF
jgi:hypothetical protein